MAQDSIRLGYCPDAPEQPYWPEIEALLAQAGAWSNSPAWEPGDLVWVGIENGQIIAAATTRKADGDPVAQLVNVGGKEMGRWAADLEAMLCRWARDAGAERFRAHGRKGWLRVRLGWVPGDTDENGLILFEKALR